MCSSAIELQVMYRRADHLLNGLRLARGACAARVMRVGKPVATVFLWKKKQPPKKHKAQGFPNRAFTLRVGRRCSLRMRRVGFSTTTTALRGYMRTFSPPAAPTSAWILRRNPDGTSFITTSGTTQSRHTLATKRKFDNDNDSPLMPSPASPRVTRVTPRPRTEPQESFLPPFTPSPSKPAPTPTEHIVIESAAPLIGTNIEPAKFYFREVDVPAALAAISAADAKLAEVGLLSLHFREVARLPVWTSWLSSVDVFDHTPC